MGCQGFPSSEFALRTLFLVREGPLGNSPVQGVLSEVLRGPLRDPLRDPLREPKTSQNLSEPEGAFSTN